MPLKQAKNRWLNLKMSNSVINVLVTVFEFILLLLGAVKCLLKLKKEIPNFSFVEYWKRITIMTIFAENFSIS